MIKFLKVLSGRVKTLMIQHAGSSNTTKAHIYLQTYLGIRAIR